jgi:hypothetical protein
MKVRILDEAEQDLLDGYRFYESQRQGLGSEFLESLFLDIDSLDVRAGIHPQYFGHYRLLARRFPFAMYYRIDGNTVCVQAVLDCRRNPTRAKKRMRPKRNR